MSSEKLILQLKSEAEILQLCLNALPFTKIEQKQNVQQLIETTLQKISQELNTLKKETDKDKLELCQLRINRILLQNEKIFNSYQEFKQIVRSVPRIQQPINNEQPISQPKQQMKEEKQLTIRDKQQPDINDYRGLQQQINQLKFELDSVAREVSTHDHMDYKSQIRTIQEENIRILADYHLLKNDNTELLHTCNQLHRQIQILSQQNDEMQKEIEILKSLNTSSSKQQTMGNQRYLIPLTKGNQDF